MDRIKELLTRKFGPLPAWAWLGIFAVGVYYYRNKISGGVSGTGTGSVGPAPTTPQPGQVLQPGESYYDPNTGGLVTAPGGGGGAGNGNTGDGGSGNSNNGNSSGNGTPGSTSNPVAASNTKAWNQYWLAKAANKRRTKRRYNQWWLARKEAKQDKRQARSRATVKNHVGGRTTKRASGGVAAARDRSVSPQIHSSQRLRQRAKTPAVRHTVNQHPESRGRSAGTGDHVVAPRPSTRRETRVTSKRKKK